jgi:hypothetical protein
MADQLLGAFEHDVRERLDIAFDKSRDWHFSGAAKMIQRFHKNDFPWAGFAAIKTPEGVSRKITTGHDHFPLSNGFGKSELKRDHVPQFPFVYRSQQSPVVTRDWLECVHGACGRDELRELERISPTFAPTSKAMSPE